MLGCILRPPISEKLDIETFWPAAREGGRGFRVNGVPKKQYSPEGQKTFLCFGLSKAKLS